RLRVRGQYPAWLSRARMHKARLKVHLLHRQGAARAVLVAARKSDPAGNSAITVSPAKAGLADQEGSRAKDYSTFPGWVEREMLSAHGYHARAVAGYRSGGRAGVV